MDGATLDLNDLKAIFGSSLIDLNKGQERQTNVLSGLQDLIDQKIEHVTDHLKKLDDVVDELKALQKGETRKGTPSIVKKISGIPQGMSNILSSMVKPFTSSKADDSGSKKAGIKVPYQRETVNIEFTPKTKVMLQDILDVTIEALYDKFTPVLDDISDTLKMILKNTLKEPEKQKSNIVLAEQNQAISLINEGSPKLFKAVKSRVSVIWRSAVQTIHQKDNPAYRREAVSASRSVVKNNPRKVLALSNRTVFKSHAFIG
jgi:Mg2+ and Co2+ transporter CorA